MRFHPKQTHNGGCGIKGIYWPHQFPSLLHVRARQYPLLARVCMPHLWMESGAGVCTGDLRAQGTYGSHGFKTGTRALSKSLRSRMTRVDPWCRAVAAIIRSGWEYVWAVFRPSYTRTRHLSITSSVIGNTRRSKHGPDFIRDPSFNSSRRLSSWLKSSIPKRSSTSETALM